MAFEVLAHPADVGFRATGGSREELFANCAHALMSLIFDTSNIAAPARWELAAEAADEESLLVNWLNEVLYYVDTKRLAFASLDVSFSSPLHLRCLAAGEERDPDKHPVRVSVKAVTYHQLRLWHTGNVWTAEVFVDV